MRSIGPAGMGSGNAFIDRIIGVAKLEQPVYEGIKRDPTALNQAVLVVVLSALATNVWVAIFAPRGLTSAIGGVVLALVAWLLFTGLTWWLGKTWFAPRWLPPDFMQLLRLTGFATAPNILNVFGFVPLIGWLVLMIASIWSLITAYMAIRVGLAATDRNALAATFIAYLANALLFALAANLLGIGRGGLFL
jgi:hypothetical protein